MSTVVRGPTTACADLVQGHRVELRWITGDEVARRFGLLEARPNYCSFTAVGEFSTRNKRRGDTPDIRRSFKTKVYLWCREGESNPQGTKYRRILSPLRLPVPPSRLRS